MTNRHTTLLVTAGALLAPAIFAFPAWAETGKCQRAIVTAASTYARVKTNKIANCEIKRIKDSNTDPCPDSEGAQEILDAAADMAQTIERACGGHDRICGADLTDEDTPASVGFPATCPNFEGGACSQTLDDCGDVSACLQCIDDGAVDQAVVLYFAALNPSDRKLEKALNKCQVEMAKAARKMLRGKTSTLKKCWASRIDGKHSDNCPDVGGGSFASKAAVKIGKLETDLIDKVCTKCGGADKLCDDPVAVVNPLAVGAAGSGGGDDLTLAAIGFASTCPAVTVPGGPSCGGTIATLADLIECVACVTEFKVDCATRAQVPQFGALPAECNP